MAISPAQKKAIEEVLNTLLSATGSPRKRQLAGMFLELVDRHDWPEYYQVIPEPRALNNIQTSLEKNRYKDPLDAYTDLSLVFLNALFYNEPDSQIAIDAQTLKNLLESEWKSKALPIPRDSPPPSSAQKVHEPAPKQAPKPVPAHTPAPAAKPATALPTLTVPVPSTSTFVYTKPTPIQTAAVSPVEAPPAPEYPESEPESDLEEELDLADEYAPAGAPTDTQVVRQLERGLPRYAPILGPDGGWMADVKHERHLEICQAIKAYRDGTGVKLSTALDGVPDDKMPISFKLLESRSRSKTFYTSSRPFDADVARMFESGRRYYLQRGDGVAGIPTTSQEEWGRVVTLQRVAHTFTSSHAPPLPLTHPLVIPPPLRAPGAVSLESVTHKGFVLRAGDYVHLIAAADTDDPAAPVVGLGRPGKPLVARVTACWRDDAGEGGISVRWFLRAEEISHIMPPARRTGPIEGELVQTERASHHILADVIERVAVQHASSAARGRPRAPRWFPGWPLYVCGYRYDSARGVVRRIRKAEWSAGVRSTSSADASSNGEGSSTQVEEEELDLFERPVRLGTAQKKQTGLVDRSVVSAGGVAVASTEKLGPETARHFERDPMTGEVLWFPGPPMHVARAPPPRHRLEYLHFLAKKYNPEVVEPEPAGPKLEATETSLVNGNGSGKGVAGADMDGDVSMGSDDRAATVEIDPPPAKRQRLSVEGKEDDGRYMSASERLREALRSAGVS
ncbi:hypothetical protein C8R43DRAFT_322842 [Mycena crocata]|nr:hypothetical protein C8R43DRAFT_322842 [Mycena crocata]